MSSGRSVQTISAPAASSSTRAAASTRSVEPAAALAMITYDTVAGSSHLNVDPVDGIDLVSTQIPVGLERLDASGDFLGPRAHPVVARLGLPGPIPPAPGVLGERRAKAGLVPRLAPIDAHLDSDHGPEAGPSPPGHTDLAGGDHPAPGEEVRDTERLDQTPGLDSVDGTPPILFRLANPIGLLVLIAGEGLRHNAD